MRVFHYDRDNHIVCQPLEADDVLVMSWPLLAYQQLIASGGEGVACLGHNCRETTK